MNRLREYIDLYLDNVTVSRSEATSHSLEDARKEFLRESGISPGRFLGVWRSQGCDGRRGGGHSFIYGDAWRGETGA